MATNEYPIDDEFWKWWDTYWEKQEFQNKKVDISLNFCYNNYRKEKNKENPKNGISKFHEFSSRLERAARG